jgi:hypothetical protein
MRSIVTPCGECVEVASEGERVFLRTTVVQERWLDMDRGEWDRFVDAVKRGVFDKI